MHINYFTDLVVFVKRRKLNVQMILHQLQQAAYKLDPEKSVSMASQIIDSYTQLVWSNVTYYIHMYMHISRKACTKKTH